MAALLGIQPASVYQLFLRKSFPDGMPMGRERIWPLDAVLRYVIECKRQLVTRIPRVFPRCAPIPALFCGARSLTVTSRFGGLFDCIALVWQPSDGGSQVALAYSLDSHDPSAVDVLASLHADGQCNIGAVVVPEGHRYVGAGGVLMPPDVTYADTADLRLRELTWLDFAYLLQTDLPWWPKGLRDAASMLVWQPGSQPFPVVPRSSLISDPYALLRLGATVHPPADRVEATTVFEWFSERGACLICPPAETEPAVVPGIYVAARAVAPGTGAALSVDIAAGRGRPTSAEIARVLHSRIDPSTFNDQVSMLADTVDAWSPLIERVEAVKLGSANPLARQFINRLRESAAPVDELGFLIVAAHGLHHQRIDNPMTLSQPRRLELEQDPDFWIARFDDTVYFTVPHNISTAVGVLHQLDITQDRRALPRDFTAWWADSIGNSWPVPGCDHHEAGFDGNGPRALAAAVTALAQDAAGSVDDTRELRAGRHCRQLVKLLVDDNYPTLIRRFTDQDRVFRWHASGNR